MAPDLKAEKFSRLAEAILRVAAQAGTEGVTFSKVARSAGVSRAWIYKYIGTGRSQLLEFGVDHFGKIFTALDHPLEFKSAADWLNSLAGKFEALLNHTRAHPQVVSLYFRYRGNEGLLGKRISRIEALQSVREVAEIQRLFGFSELLAKRAAEAIGSTRMGWAHAWAFGDLKDLAQLHEARLLFIAAVEGILAGTRSSHK